MMILMLPYDELFGYIFATYFLVAVFAPLAFILFMPFIIPIVFFVKSSNYARSYKRLMVVEYQVPKDLTPAEIGYIYDESSNSNELIAEILYANNHNPTFDYQLVATQLDIDAKDTINVNTESPLYGKIMDALSAFSTKLENNLHDKSIISSTTNNNYRRDVNKSSKRAFKISRYSVVYPFSFILILAQFADLRDGKPFNPTAVLAVIAGLLAFYGVHGASWYVIEMLRLKAVGKSKIKSLAGDKQIPQSLWDQVRGYREYLKEVELPRLSTQLAIKDTQALKDDKISYMVALGLVSNHDKKAILELTGN